MKRHDEYTFFIDDVELFLVEDEGEEPFEALNDIPRAASVLGITPEGTDAILSFIGELKEAIKKDLISIHEEKVG